MNFRVDKNGMSFALTVYLVENYYVYFGCERKTTYDTFVQRYVSSFFLLIRLRGVFNFFCNYNTLNKFYASRNYTKELHLPMGGEMT